MDTREEILAFLHQNKSTIFSNYHLSKIGLFGSYARGDADAESDVDIVFDFAQSPEDVYLLKSRLRTYLSSAFGRTVDLAREKYLKPYAKDAILKETLYV